MIVVDTSVCIHHFNSVSPPSAEQLDNLLAREAILVGDLVLTQIMQGLRSEAQRLGPLDY